MDGTAADIAAAAATCCPVAADVIMVIAGTVHNYAFATSICSSKVCGRIHLSMGQAISGQSPLGRPRRTWRVRRCLSLQAVELGSGVRSMFDHGATIRTVASYVGVPAVLKGGAAVSLLTGQLPINDMDFDTPADGTQLMEALTAAAHVLSTALQPWFEGVMLPASVVPDYSMPSTAFFGGSLHPMSGTDPHRPVPIVCTYHGELVCGSGDVFKLGRLKLALRNVEHNASIQIPFVDVVADCPLRHHSVEVCVGCGVCISAAAKDELVDDLCRMLFRETNWAPWTCAKMKSRVCKLFSLLNCVCLSDRLAAFYYTEVRRRAHGVLSYLMSPAPVSIGHHNLHGNELRVVKDIEKIKPGALEYDDYLGFVDAASIACIECESHQTDDQ